MGNELYSKREERNIGEVTQKYALGVNSKTACEDFSYSLEL